jgi:type IV secretory pathway TraG/TraD family ATPase VirD4
MGALMLAAAIDTRQRTILDVFRWVMAPGNTEPVNILAADGRFPLVRDQLDEYAHHNEKTRSSEYGTAQTVLGFLAHDTVRPWVTPSRDRVPFYPDMVTTGTPTLYLLSREGAASTGALTAALTAAVYEAARDEALAQGGRLGVPMVMVLDEIANVCRWEELPDLYTHMGSQGILPISLFQSYTQAKHIWGPERAALLLSVCSVLIAGGNVKGDSFHEGISHMVGKYTRTSVSESWAKGTRSTTRTNVEEETVSVADLRKLPRQYSLMFTGGVSAIILRHVPRWRRRYKKVARTQATTVTAPVVHRDYAPGVNPAPRRASGWGQRLSMEDQA